MKTTIQYYITGVTSGWCRGPFAEDRVEYHADKLAEEKNEKVRIERRITTFAVEVVKTVSAGDYA